MTELPLIFIGGLLGSSHCVGMCGPLAIALGMPSKRPLHNLQRQLLFSFGRLSTYGFMGSLAAFAGLWFSHWLWLAVRVQGILGLVGGVALVMFGLMATGILPRQTIGRLTLHSCTSSKWIKTLMISPSLTGAFLAGVFTGFIPCGLVYGFIVVAAASASVGHGWLVMTTFGAGTVPLLVLTGCGASLLSVTTRARVLQIAAWCVVVAGVISIARGVAELQIAPGSTDPACPFCHSSHS